MNAAMGVARKCRLAERPVLERETLLRRACEFTGLDDFGDRWLEIPLEVLLEARSSEARLNPAGEWSARTQIEK